MQLLHIGTIKTIAAATIGLIVTTAIVICIELMPVAS